MNETVNQTLNGVTDVANPASTIGRLNRLSDEINALYVKLAEKYNVGYIDVQTPFDEYLKTGSSYILSSDRVHPNSVGISLLSRAIYNHPDFRVIFHD